MPARPLPDATLQLIHALRESLEGALATRDTPTLPLEERSMFGCYCFFVDGKLCIGIKNDELLVRLPPTCHTKLLEMEGLRELSPGGGMQGYFWVAPDTYTRRAQWQHWIDAALDYNPHAKASPKKQRRTKAASPATSSARSTPRSAAKLLPSSEASQASNAPSSRVASKSAKTLVQRKHSVFDDDD